MNWTVYLLLSVLSLFSGSVTTASGQGQTADAIKTLPGGDVGQCSSLEKRERARNELYQFAASIIANTTSAPTMPTMTNTYTCNGTPGWRRVAFINMTDTSYSCPTGLNLTSYSKRTCGRSHTISRGCSSTIFSAGDLPYNQVCGRIRGYQFGGTSAFYAYNSDRGIDSNYVNGISLTHGGAGRRQHIWTFAAGLTEVASSFPLEDCPCDTSNYGIIPTFVGNDLFCESGLHSAWNLNIHRIFFPDDVLWDGQNCTSTSTCCQFNNPPWFMKNLPNATNDDIELRICTSYGPSTEDTAIEFMELYAQ